jgi:hypothetical protein
MDTGKVPPQILRPNTQTRSNSRRNRNNSSTKEITSSEIIMRDSEICSNVLLDDSDSEEELIFYPLGLLTGQEGHNSLTSSFSDAYYIPTAVNQRSVCTKSTIGSVSTMSKSAITDDDVGRLSRNDSTDGNEMIFYAVNGQGAQDSLPDGIVYSMYCILRLRGTPVASRYLPYSLDRGIKIIMISHHLGDPNFKLVLIHVLPREYGVYAE